MCILTVPEQFSGIQDFGALLWVSDIQLIEVRLPQPCKILQGLEAVHGQQRTELLKHKRESTDMLLGLRCRMEIKVIAV